MKSKFKNKIFSKMPYLKENIIKELMRNTAINRFNILTISKILNEYQKSIELLIFDQKYRKSRDVMLVHPLDFSEIYAYMYKAKKNVAYGNLVEYFLENNDKNKSNTVFTILPATMIEIIFHLTKIFEQVRSVTKKYSYDELMQKPNINKLVNAYKSETDELNNKLINFEFSPLEEFAMTTVKMALDKTNFTPLKNLMRLIGKVKEDPEKKFIIPLEKLGKDYPRSIEKQNYKNEYQKITALLKQKRKTKIYDPEKFGTITNNYIDAINFIDTLSLNDTYYDSKEYFSIITRDIPAEVFESILWQNDPVIKMKYIPGEKYKPITRYTQYAYYNILIQKKEGTKNHFGELTDIMENFKKYFEDLINIFEKEGRLIKNRPKFQLTKDQEYEIRNILTSYIGIPNSNIKKNLEEDKYYIFAETLLNENKFKNCIKDVENEMSNWAKNLKNFIDRRLNVYDDDLLADVAKLLEKYF